MQSLGHQSALFVFTCDDRKEPFAAVSLKVQKAKQAFVVLGAEVDRLEEQIQWKGSVTLSEVSCQLNELESKIRVIANNMYGPCGLTRQIPLQDGAVGFVIDLSQLELEVGLSLQTIKKLQKICHDSLFRNQKIALVKGEEQEGVFVGENAYRSLYSFWQHVSYATQGYYACGYYKACAKLGSDLEAQVGKKLGSLIAQMHRRIVTVCQWEQDEELAKCKTALRALENSFLGLCEGMDELEADYLKPYVLAYRDGLLYAFGKARFLLEIMQRLAESGPQQVFTAIHAAQKQYAAVDSVERVVNLYKLLQNHLLLKDQAFNPKQFPDDVVARKVTLLGDIHACQGLKQLEVQTVDLPMHAVAKRMLLALHFSASGELDMQLERMLPGIIEPVFLDMAKAYEALYAHKRVLSSKELHKTVLLIEQMQELAMPFSEPPLLGYLMCVQRYVELVATLGKEKGKLVKGLLANPLGAIATRYGFSALLKMTEDSAAEVNQEHFSSLMIRLVAASMFAAEGQKQIASHSQLVSVLEDVRHENALICLKPDVVQMLTKNSLEKITLFCAEKEDAPKLLLGMREMRLLNDMVFEKGIEAGAFSWQTIDLQMALYKLIHAERLHSGARPLTDCCMAKMLDADFSRWYAAFDDLYRKNKFAIRGCKPALVQQTVSHASLEAIVTKVHKPFVTGAVWDAVIGRKAGEYAEHQKLYKFLIERIAAVKERDVALELIIQSIKQDAALYAACKQHQPLKVVLDGYEKTYRPDRSDSLYNEALEVLVHIGKQNLYTYAKAWQKCIEFGRKAELAIADREQHEALTALLYAKLDASQNRLGLVKLTGAYRFQSLDAMQDEGEQCLFRHLACCLYGRNDEERVVAQGAVSAKIEGAGLAGLSQVILQLVYENTMEKLYKGVFDVGPKELQLFMEGPVKSVMRQKTLTFTDSKIQHALFFLAVAEQNKDSKPVRELFVQHSRLDVYEQWYSHYVQFLASGPIAVEGLGANWQSAQAKSLQLTNAWKVIHSPGEAVKNERSSLECW